MERLLNALFIVIEYSFRAFRTAVIIAVFMCIAELSTAQSPGAWEMQQVNEGAQDVLHDPQANKRSFYARNLQREFQHVNYYFLY